MSKLVLFTAIYLLGEIVSYFIFKFMDFLLESEKKWDWRINRSVFKGSIERFFLFLALVYHIPQALIAFGALKIATRFSDEKDKISLDYFFIGNITSLTIAIFYYVIFQNLVVLI